MPRMAQPPATWKLVRSGNLRARLRATRDGFAAIRLYVGGAALETGALDHLAAGGASTAELARELPVADERLLAAFLRVGAAAGLVRDGGGQWSLSSAGRAVVERCSSRPRCGLPIVTVAATLPG